MQLWGGRFNAATASDMAEFNNSLPFDRRLGELIGPQSGKLHTGRSRNDQVATDLRLYVLDHLPALRDGLRQLQGALVAQAHPAVAFPGYAHGQRAQPILLAHWFLSHFWPLERDLERLAELRRRVAVCPLGSAALAEQLQRAKACFGEAT